MRFKDLAIIGALFLPVFFGAGVVVSYLFAQWIPDKPQAQQKQPSTEETLPPPPKSQPDTQPEITPADRKAAKKVALEFLPAYLSFSPKQPEVFVKRYRHLMTPRMQEIIREDSNADPLGLKVIETEATPIEDLQAEQEGRIIWNVWATIEKEKEGKADLAFHVTLIKEDDQWRVEEVEYVEYPDAGE